MPSEYTPSEAARMAGISEALLSLWLETERFVPSMELQLAGPDHSHPLHKILMRDYRQAFSKQYVFSQADITRLRNLVDSGRAFEKEHMKGTNWTIAELARAWNFSTDTIREWFENEQGILMLERPKTRKKRGYKTFTIPEEVADRVKRSHSL